MNVGRRTLIWGTAGVAALASAVIVVLALTTVGNPHTDKPTPRPAGSAVSPTPAPTALPHVATAIGTISAWKIAPETEIGTVAPEVGDAADGAICLSVDAPAIDKPVVVASVSVPVKAGVRYDVSAKVRLLSERPAAVGAKLHFGSQVIALPALDANWTEIKATLTPDTPDISVGLEVESPVLGLDLDDIRIVASDGVNVVPNPSFEAVTGVGRIANDSLVLSAPIAAIAVALPAGAAHWEAKRGNAIVEGGVLPSTGGLQAIPLDHVDGGYLQFSVTDANGVTTATPVVLIGRGSPRAIPDPRFGVSTHLEQATYDSAARYARSLGVSTIRNDVSWKRNELKRGVYNFDPVYTREFAKLHANGLSALGILGYGNKLYGNGLVPDNPDAIAAFGRYSAAVAKEFDLSAVEVYNEFNMTRFNTGKCGTDPNCYLPILAAARDQVKAMDPNVVIVSGATANYDPVWLNGLWRDGGLAYSDAMSFHPYQVTKDPDALAGIVADARAGMQQYGKGAKPIWITELGTPATPEWGTEDEQATYLLKASVTALGSGAEKLYWYDLINDTPDQHALESNFGLFGSPIAGVAALPPKPAAFVEALMIDELRGKDAVPATSLKESVISYKFGAEADSVTVAWAPKGDTTVDYKTTIPVDVVTTDGHVVTVKPKRGIAVINVPKDGVFIRAARMAAG